MVYWIIWRFPNRYYLKISQQILFEDFPTDRKEQLNKREGEVISEIATLNKNIAGREYKGYQKEYFENNKDKIKEYREANKKQYILYYTYI